MKILTLHCDYIKFKPLKKALKSAEELRIKDEIEVKEPLVVLTAVEKGDNELSVSQLVDSVKKTAEEVNAKSIVLYPYAHLSSNLASPEIALKCLNDTESELKKTGLKVTRAPFGYYKEFELKCKGHPLSELSREFRGEGHANFSKKGNGAEEKVDENERLQLVKRLSKISMQAAKGKKI